MKRGFHFGKMMLFVVAVWLFLAQMNVARAVDPAGITGVATLSTSGISLINPISQTATGPFFSNMAGVGNSNLFDVAITPDGKTALFSNFGNSLILFADISDPTSPTLSPTSVTLSFFAEDIAITPDGKYALVTDGGFSAKIAVIDIPNKLYMGDCVTTGIGLQAIAISADGKTVMTVDYFANSVHSFLLNPTNGLLTYTGTSTTVLSPVNVEFSPDGKTAIVVSSATTSTLSGVAPAVYRVTAPGVVEFAGKVTIPGQARGAQSLVFSHAGDKAYLYATRYDAITTTATATGNEIHVLDVASSGTVTHSGTIIPLPLFRGTSQLFGVDCMSIDPSGQYLYASNCTLSGAVDQLAIIDLQSNSVVKTLTPGITSAVVPIGVSFPPVPRVRVVDDEANYLTLDSPLDFGTLPLDKTGKITKTLTVQNCSPEAISLKNPSVPPGFQISGFPTTLAAGASASFTLSLPLGAPALFGGTLQVHGTGSTLDLNSIFTVTGTVLPYSTSVTSVIKVTAKNCGTPVVTTSGTLASIALPGASKGTLKIEKLAASAKTPSQSGVTYINSCAGITSVTVTGDLSSFQTNTPVMNLLVSGALGSLKGTKAGLVTKATASAFKSVSITLDPSSFDLGSSTTIVTRLISTATSIDPKIKPSITLTGLGLADFEMPKQTVTVKVSGKKVKTGTAQAHVSGKFIAGPDLNLNVTGGNIIGDIVAASVKAINARNIAGVGGKLGDDFAGDTWVMTGASDLGSVALPSILSVSASAGINASFVCGMSNASTNLGTILPTYRGSLAKISVGRGTAVQGTYWSRESFLGDALKVNPKEAASGFQPGTDTTISR